MPSHPSADADGVERPTDARHSPAGEVLIDVRGLSKTYVPYPLWMRAFMRTQVREPVVALDDVTLQVRRGQICAVAGANGAGKSTLFRLLTGLLEPTAGEAFIGGHNPVRHSAECRRLIGYVSGDDRSLYLRQTVRQNLQFRAILVGVPRQQRRRRVAEVAELVGLGEALDRVGFALSAGMRSRLQLASALLHQPPVLILDEPTSAVDPVSAHRLVTYLQGLTAELGLAVLFSTHRVDELETLGEHVVLLDHGRLVHTGPLGQLRERAGKPVVTVHCVDSSGATAVAGILRRTPGVETVDVAESVVRIQTARPVGEVLSELGEPLRTVRSVDEVREPVRELLARLLDRDDPAQGPETAGDTHDVPAPAEVPLDVPGVGR